MLVVTEVTGNVIPGLAFLGIPDPTGATAFNVLYTDLPGDSGAVMNVSDAGSLPLSGALGFNVPLTWNTPAILNHSPFGGELNVETILTASSGATAIFPENFSLSGGIAPPQPVTALNCNTAGRIGTGSVGKTQGHTILSIFFEMDLSEQPSWAMPQGSWITVPNQDSINMK